MNYDFELDMDRENSLSVIIKQIHPGSKVLEFGPAMGRMTKYLKEKLNCDVYIIEMDKEGYDSSINYAIDGYFGNAEMYEWFEKFKDIRFDYIVFADVIEHLLNPKEVILKAVKLLKYKGKVIFSVPNVAHNSVIIDLINNKFNYSEVGLLDNTHVRFYTYYTLKEMLNQCNLVVCDERAIYAYPDETEFYNNYDMVSKEISERLKSRDFGNVYQYVFNCINKDEYLMDKENILIEKNIKTNSPIETFKLYFNDGSVLNENNTLQKNIYMGRNNFEADIKSFNIENEIRLDFTEESCIVKIDNIYINDIAVNINNLKGNYTYNAENYYIFLKDDPFIFIHELPKKCNHIKIEFTVEKLFVSKLIEDYINRLIEIQQANIDINKLELQTAIDNNNQQQYEINLLKHELSHKDELINELKLDVMRLKDNNNDFILKIEALQEMYKSESDKFNKLKMKLDSIENNVIIRQIMKIFKI